MHILTFASELATHLTAMRKFAWHARASKYEHMEDVAAEIIRMDGAALFLRMDYRSKTRVTVTATFPHGHRPWGLLETIEVRDVGGQLTGKTREIRGELPFTCTVSIGRDPKAAAAHIVRSLLLRYEEAYATSAREAAAEKRSQQAQDAISVAVLEAAGLDPVLRKQSGPWNRSRVHACGLSVEPRQDGVCEIRGEIPQDMAIEIVRQLRARYGQTESTVQGEGDEQTGAIGVMEAAE